MTSRKAAPPAAMHNHADQFGKNLLREALSAAAVPETEVEVVAATQRIDVYAVPDPARAAERPKMGLLGELSVEPALFEPFRNTPSLARVRRCISKQLTWHHELERRARAARSGAKKAAGAPPKVALPWLVVISPGRPETVFEDYECRAIRLGVYEAVAGLHMRVVVLAELPRTRETLLLRMLGAGRLLEEAMADLSALPDDSWENGVMTPLVIHFRLVGRRASKKWEADVTAMRAWYEDFLVRVRNEGRVEEAARAVLTALRVRGIAVPEATRERILAQKDPERLERWLERAIVATSLAEVLDDPS